MLRDVRRRRPFASICLGFAALGMSRSNLDLEAWLNLLLCSVYALECVQLSTIPFTVTQMSYSIEVYSDE